MTVLQPVCSQMKLNIHSCCSLKKINTNLDYVFLFPSFCQHHIFNWGFWQVVRLCPSVLLSSITLLSKLCALGLRDLIFDPSRQGIYGHYQTRNSADQLLGVRDNGPSVPPEHLGHIGQKSHFLWICLFICYYYYLLIDNS